MKLDQLSIHIGNNEIIHPINVDINKGEIFVLMGPSGSGKTTLLKGIAGLVPISTGKVILDNAQGSIGIAFQEPRLFPHMNIMDNLAFGLRAKGFSKSERYKMVEQYLTILQLKGLEKRFPHELSGGQRQRVSLGRAIILKPNILLLDEPFSSLDAPLRYELTEWLYHLQKEQGFSILWVTHYVDEAFSVANRIGVIMEGEIKRIGNPVDVYRNPSSEEVANFFSLPNRFSRKVWKELFPNTAISEMCQMGWISSSELILDDERPQVTNDRCLGWFEGKVTRIKHETNGQKVIVKNEHGNWDLLFDGWKSVPQMYETVKVGIPYEKIIWYPK